MSYLELRTLKSFTLEYKQVLCSNKDYLEKILRILLSHQPVVYNNN